MIQVRFILIAILFPTSMPSFAGDGDERSRNDALRGLVTEHCLACHDNATAEGDVDLTTVSAESLLRNADLLRRVVHVLDTRQMPPDDQPQPSSEQIGKVVDQLRSLLHQVANHPTSRIRTPIRRMNRFQYNNAVIDLFELKCTVFSLPEQAMRIHNDYFEPASGKMPQTVTVGNRPLGKSQMIEPRLDGVAAFPQDLRAEHGFDNAPTIFHCLRC
ncbi:MAG: c-type cytochrome domain-containing protein [Pirellulaceae bacterium]